MRVRVERGGDGKIRGGEDDDSKYGAVWWVDASELKVSKLDDGDEVATMSFGRRQAWRP